MLGEASLPQLDEISDFLAPELGFILTHDEFAGRRSSPVHAREDSVDTRNALFA
jgi:hypothetical protein